MKTEHDIGFVLFMCFVSFLLGMSGTMAINAINNQQGNHDTTVSQGNHDTTVDVRRELCEEAIIDVFNVELEGKRHAKVHAIAGANGDEVANVIILYKDFPISFKTEDYMTKEKESDGR